jgi:hypothetical protein
VELSFQDQEPPEQGKEETEEEQQQKTQELINGILNSLQENGATNMLINPSV